MGRVTGDAAAVFDAQQRQRRERYTGTWLPEPVLAGTGLERLLADDVVSWSLTRATEAGAPGAMAREPAGRSD